MRHQLRYLIFLSALLSNSIFAEMDKERPPEHPPLPSAEYLRLTGYVDGSYNYLLRSNQFISGTDNRLYDLAENGFSLQQAAATLSFLPSNGVGGLINIVTGRDALKISPNGQNADVFDAGDFGVTVSQAYLQYKVAALTIQAGELLTLAGIESYNYTLDDNFSRSILDGYAQPGIHVGLRTISKPNEYWKFVLGLNNGWKTIQTAAKLNHIELGLGYTHNETFNIMASLQNGSECLTGNVCPGPKGTSNLIDVYSTFHITKAFSVAMNGDYGVQSKGTRSNGTTGRVIWDGMALYANYIFNPKWRTSLRGELFVDGDGFQTGVRQSWRELTLTLGYLPKKQFMLRAEVRHDISNKSAFKDKTGSGSSSNQQSFALEGLYQFDKEIL